jgi:hypothetical protein
VASIVRSVRNLLAETYRGQQERAKRGEALKGDEDKVRRRRDAASALGRDVEADLEKMSGQRVSTPAANAKASATNRPTLIAPPRTWPPDLKASQMARATPRLRASG